MANKLKDWSQEGCSTTGQGDLVLTGVVSINQTRFRDGFGSEEVYYSISDGANREVGMGSFNGSDRIVRTTVHATLVNGTYTDGSPSPIILSGTAVVSGTFNAHAYDALLASISSNAARITTNENNISVQAGLAPTQAQKDAMDQANAPSATNPFATQAGLTVATDHISKTPGAHLASAISSVPTATMAPMDVQGSLEDLDSRINDHLDDPVAAHEASDIRYDDAASALNVVDVQAAIDELSAAAVILDADVSFRESAISGLEQGGGLSGNGATAITVEAGNGEIIDSYSDPEDQATIDVSWIQQTYDLLANAGMPVVTGLGITDIGIDVNGLVVNAPNGFSSAQRRDLIKLGSVQYQDQVITGVLTAPVVSNQVGNTLLDLIDYIELGSRIKGMVLRPTDVSLAELSMWRDSGSIFIVGGNYAVAKNDQNVRAIVAAGTALVPFADFYPILYNNGTTQLLAAVSVVPTGQFEQGGAGSLDNIANGKTVIHYLFESMTGDRFMVYAQQEYDDHATAVTNLFADRASTLFPVETDKMILMGQIVVDKNASVWGVTAEIFPLDSATSSGSGAGSATNAININYSDTYALGSNVQSAIDSLAALKLSTNQHASLAAASGGANPPTGANAIATVDDVGVNTDILVAHIDGSNYRHNATAIGFTPAGGISATDVDGALLELDAEKAAASDLEGAIGRTTRPLAHLPLSSNLAFAQGNGHVDFERLSDASYVDRYGVLQFVGWDEPRFEEQGLLVEGYGKNLALQSNNFNNAQWIKHGGVVNVTSIPGTNPAGLDNVIQIKNDGGSSSTFGVHSAVLNAGVVTSFSAWVRSSREGMVFRMGQDSGAADVTLTTEWVRHKIENYTPGNTLFTLFGLGEGDTEEYFEIAYSQAEEHPFVTSFMFSKTTAVERAPERCKATAPGNCTSAVASNSITVEIDILGVDPVNTQRLFNMSDDSDRSIDIIAGADPTMTYVAASIMMPVAELIHNMTKFGWSYDAELGEVGKFRDSSLVTGGPVTPTAATLPGGMDLLNNGWVFDTNTFGHIRNLKIWDIALTGAEMELL